MNLIHLSKLAPAPISDDQNTPIFTLCFWQVEAEKIAKLEGPEVTCKVCISEGYRKVELFKQKIKYGNPSKTERARLELLGTGLARLLPDSEQDHFSLTPVLLPAP